MLTRRSLFARLSAVALAPLVKWAPKAEGYIVGSDVASGLSETVVQLPPRPIVGWVSFTIRGTDEELEQMEVLGTEGYRVFSGPECRTYYCGDDHGLMSLAKDGCLSMHDGRIYAIGDVDISAGGGIRVLEYS